MESIIPSKPTTEQIEIEIDTKRIISMSIIDHDYFMNPRNKQPKKPLKITELKAIYNCTACGYKTMCKKTLIQHNCSRKKTKNLPPGYQKCPTCNSTSPEHKNTHSNAHSKCSECLIPNEIKENAFKCPKCNYITEKRTNLKIHMHIHSRGTAYKCTECQFSGRDLKDLIRHYGDIKDLKCHCGYTTHVKQQMVTHRRSHTNEKPYVCGICNYSTRDRSDLYRHIKRHE